MAAAGEARIREGMLVLAAILIYAAAALYGVSGKTGGWVSLTLFVFSPTFLAHGALATPDVMTAMCFLVAAGALWRAMHDLALRSALLSMLAVSALFLLKFSALIFIPVALVML